MKSYPLSGLDAAFLSAETPDTPMHTLQVLVFSGAAAPTVEQIADQADVWLDRVPELRFRLQTVPLGLGQPVLIPDDHFDLRKQVEVVEPQEGQTLDEVVSEIAGTLLPRDRALWAMTIVSGLPNNQWAAVVKIHHAFADGSAKKTMLERLFGIDLPPQNPGVQEGAPSVFSAVLSGVWNVLVGIVALPIVAYKSIVGMLQVRLRRKRGGELPAQPFEIDVLPFNKEVHERRVFRTAQLPLDRIKAVKTASRTSINDIVLALTAGALRRYLERHDSLPTRDLVASVPVGAGSGHAIGNHVSSTFAALPSHISRPRRQLRYVHRKMSAAKEELVVAQMDIGGWAQAVPPFLFQGVRRIIGFLRTKGFLRPAINLIVSNVRGPANTLRLGPHELESIYSVGPLLAGVGLNVTVWSYRDQLEIALLATPEGMPELEGLAADFEPALADLEENLAQPESIVSRVADLSVQIMSGEYAAPRRHEP